MSNIDKILHAHQDLFTELDPKNAETINGGAERFRVQNEVSNYSMSYDIDGTSDSLQPGYYQDWTAYSGGIISFDSDGRSGFQSKEYNLGNGRTYAFRPNSSTSNPYDFELYDIT